MTIETKSELARVASKLASPTLSEAKITDTLRALGFRASAIGLRTVLEFADALQPQFQQLGSLFPNAKKILEDFQRSRDLLAALDSAEAAALVLPAVSTAPGKYHSTPFCGAITHPDRYITPADVRNHPVLAEVIAFLWLTHSCLHATPGVATELEMCPPISACFQSIRTPAFILEDHHDVLGDRHESYLNNIDEWVDFVVPIFVAVWRTTLGLEEIRTGFLQCVRALRQLEYSSSHGLASLADVQTDSLPATAQRGSSLSERERLNSHHNAFHGNEIKALSGELLKILDLEVRNASWLGINARPTDFFEAIIISLALATGRTINCALHMPIRRQPHPNTRRDKALDVDGVDECIFLELYPGHENDFYYPIWKRAISPHHTLSLPLPSHLGCLKVRGVYFDGATTLEDCLPYSLVPWEERCHAWLGKRLRGSRKQVDRRIRDALARALYYDTANPALLTWLATPLDRISRQAESLSHYLNPLSLRTIETYGSACKQLFSNRYGAPKDIRESVADSDWAFSSHELRQIAGSFLDAISYAEQTGNHLEYHNALSRCLLALLTVATGHRKSRAPFHFSWDVLADQNLVFISDKQTIGSEARLVPIPQWISDLVSDYSRHLVQLHNRVFRDHPQLAAAIREVLPALDHFEHDRSPSEPVEPERREIGQFFVIDANYRAHPLTTRDLEKSYSHISRKGIRYFRASIAESLWQQGLSGHQIEAFLGHNGDMHAFGESSAWSVNEWAEPVRKAQEIYLRSNGWVPIQIKLTAAIKKRTVRALPSLQKSDVSYEGRSLSNDSARARARMIIRDLLPAEWFDSDSAEITDDDVRTLKVAAEEMLASDPSASSKVAQALATEVQNVRAIRGRSIASTLSNLTRVEPGPIDISFSRHYANASAFRSWWLDNLGNYSRNSDTNYLDRAAAIGVSLIVFDSILDKATWSAILMSILTHRTEVASGCITVRAEISRRAKIYDKSIVCSSLTSAQIVGFEKLYHSTTRPGGNVREIIARINKWLKSSPNGKAGLNLHQLISVFKAWWLPRLPGCMHAIATAAYSGPSPDELSACALLGISRTDVGDMSPKEDFAEVLNPPECGPQKAKSLVNRLLNEARGRFELKQQTSRSQRALLTRLLSEPGDEHKTLAALTNQVPIVSVMIGFLEHMLIEGGKRVDVFRFNSITTYFSRVSDLIELFWERSIHDIEAYEYDAAYSKLIQASGQVYTALRLFHSYLRLTHGAPSSSVLLAFERTPNQCRSSLVTMEQFEKAWTDIGSIKDDGQLIRHAKSLMSLNAQYGFRTKEALGLDVNHLLTNKPYSILVIRNDARDLKTRGKASLRVTHPLLASTKFQSHLEIVVNTYQQSASANRSLFRDATKKNELYSQSRITRAATLALRAATGNSSVVPYSLRHTAATRLSHFSIPSPRAIPVSQAANAALKGGINDETMTACFRQGFFAWPFWMDRVGMLLGHSSVDTLLNTYWHSSHHRMAEYTWHASGGITAVKPQQLASMLGMDRSVIHRKLQQLESDRACGIASALEATVVYYVNKSKIPRLGSAFDPVSTNTPPGGLMNDSDVAGHVDSWPLFDGLLRERLAHGLTLEETKTRGLKLGMPLAQVSLFLTAYSSIVRQTGITDFEPANSELLTGAARRNAVTAYGAAERERGLAIAQALFNCTDGFPANLRWFCQLWAARVDASSPWFVARDTAELSLVLFVLAALGVDRSQLEYRSANFESSALGDILTRSELESMTHQTTRLSWGRESIRESEVGIRVQQKLGTKIGDHRDTHRLMLVLACLVGVRGAVHSTQSA